MIKPALFSGLIALTSVTLFAACDDTSSNKVGGDNTFNPGGGSDAGSTQQPGDTTDGGGNTTSDGGCPNKPAGCFCGTPTTQAQWLNRCTSSAALPVNLTVKPATTADIP